jgi:hypothetical protein
MLTARIEKAVKELIAPRHCENSQESHSSEGIPMIGNSFEVIIWALLCENSAGYYHVMCTDHLMICVYALHA